jgi:hypothetical protein
LHVACHQYHEDKNAPLVGAIMEALTPSGSPLKLCAGAAEKEFEFFNDSRSTNLSAFAEKNWFKTVEAVKHFICRFGELSTGPNGPIFQISDIQRNLLHTTIAVCAIRCNGSRITHDMISNLLRVVRPVPACEVGPYADQ